MKNWIANKINGFESISKMESYALKHFVFSTPFNQLSKGKFDVRRRRIIIVLLVLYWLFIVLMVSRLIPVIKALLRYYGMNVFFILKENTNSFVVMTLSYLITIYYMKTDFIINESSHLLYDLNLLKNGFTNRLNKSNLEKMKIQSEFLYQFVKYAAPIFKITFTLFFSFYFIIMLNNLNYITKIILGCGFACWILAINHSIDLGCVYGMIYSLSINYIRLRFNQINEKLILIYDGKKKLNIKKLSKIMSEHKSIERKTQLYNSQLNRIILCWLTGMTIGMIACLYIVIFSKDYIHRIFSLFTASTVLIVEFIIIIEMAALTNAAHMPYTIFNSIIAKKKINLKTRLKVCL